MSESRVLHLGNKVTILRGKHQGRTGIVVGSSYYGKVWVTVPGDPCLLVLHSSSVRKEDLEHGPDVPRG